MIRKAFKYLLFISGLAFFYVTCSGNAHAQTYEGKVVKVADGDSITILYEGNQLRIRLAEIDAPERGQPYSRKSKEALAAYVAGKIVRVELVDIDRYERVIGQVYVGDTWVNGALVLGGYVYVYPKYATNQLLYDFERMAKEEGLGLWVLPESERVRPWDWRRQNR